MSGTPSHQTLPGEETLAECAHGQVTMTSLRMLYRGQGRQRRAFSSVPLPDVTGIEITSRRWVSLPHLVPPFVVLGATYALGLMMQEATRDPRAGQLPLIVGILLGFSLVPRAFIPRGPWLRISTRGDPIVVRLRRQTLPDARIFVDRVEEVRHRLATGITHAPDASSPGSATG